MSEFSAVSENLQDAAAICAEQQAGIAARLKQAAELLGKAHKLGELAQDLVRQLQARVPPDQYTLERLMRRLSAVGFVDHLEDTVEIQSVKDMQTIRVTDDLTISFPDSLCTFVIEDDGQVHMESIQFQPFSDNIDSVMQMQTKPGELRYLIFIETDGTVTKYIK